MCRWAGVGHVYRRQCSDFVVESPGVETSSGLCGSKHGGDSVPPGLWEGTLREVTGFGPHEWVRVGGDSSVVIWW